MTIESKNLSADSIYAQKLTKVDDFRFDAGVASVFTDMINRSIPSYAELVKYIGLLAKRYVVEKSIVYDLGCSLGAVSLSVDQSLKNTECSIIGVDYSDAMIKRLNEVTKDYQWLHPFSSHVADIREFELQNNSFTVMNFVLQFLPQEDREKMLEKVYSSLTQGGALVLSEKVKFEDKSDDELIFDLHHDFKRSQGYSDLEIAQKRDAIEEMMKIDSDTLQVKRLKSVGFSKVIKWHQAYNFVSYLAIK